MANNAPLSANEILKAKGLNEINNVIDKVLQNTGTGTVGSAISNTFYGLNHRGTNSPISVKKDYYGLTLFVKPQLNLTRENLYSVRNMLKLATTDKNTIESVIRYSLDPRSAKLENTGYNPLIDPSLPFIPMLTNNLISISGWPDVMAPTTTTAEGWFKESMPMVDGISDIYSTYDITANFRNLNGNPIIKLFLYWIRTMTYTFEGTLYPYLEDIVQRRMNYTTRIYRLVLDPTKNIVRSIAACGAAVPISVPIGAMYDYESDQPVNGSGDQASITFRCTGALYEDTILIYEFNRLVTLTKPAMKDGIRERQMISIPQGMLKLFNYRGYPRINPDNNHLEWWIDSDSFNQFINSQNDFTSKLTGD